jgi:hypothetical protein
MGIEPTRAAPPEPGNERFGGMADPKCDGRVNFRGTWAHLGIREPTAVPSDAPGGIATTLRGSFRSYSSL